MTTNEPQPQDLFGNPLGHISYVYALGDWWYMTKGTAVIERGNLRFSGRNKSFPEAGEMGVVFPLKEVRGIRW